MRILCIGDVCSPSGVQKCLTDLPKLKKKYNADAIIVNGENSALGNGIDSDSASLLFSAGADVITGGNHTLRHQNFHRLLDENPYLLRPHNLPSEYGSGYVLVDMGKYSLAVINLIGKVYLENLKAKNPFLFADELVNRAKGDGANAIFVDFHAEATSEKRALAFYLDGKVSAVFGTHTHVQTSDAQILPKKTGYITDLGMTGPKDSVLGIKKEIIISRLKDNTSDKFIFSESDCIISGCFFKTDDKTGMTLSIESFCI
ncbi:MAG: TIGR00282 family metallophosphoesterase [Clostridia bacterium]|nr:TIGR00282 family metallophosphoesterase [Clostridia bacterium]